MITSRHREEARLCAITALLFVAGASAETPLQLPEAGWVGLYHAEILAHLENGNRLDALCPATLGDEHARSRCRSAMMTAKEYRLTLRSAPSESATAEGEIVVLADPASGLHAYYQVTESSKPREFVPDLFDADWGYGPYFHQTFLQHRGNWFLLPAQPHHKAAWVNLAHSSGGPQLRRLEAGDIITSSKGDFIILGVEAHSLRVRREQPADMGCEPDAPPPLKKTEEKVLTVDELYTPTGHLAVTLKYTRGC